jgi:hypothetical protein
MRSSLRLILLIPFSFFLSGCDKGLPEPCNQVANIPGEIKVNGDKLLLKIATVSKVAKPTLNLDAYEFIFHAIGKDCNSIERFRFYANVPTNAKLNGEFQIIDTNIFTVNKITSFEYSTKIIEPLAFKDLGKIKTGTIKISEVKANQYDVSINCQFDNGKKLTVSFLHQF